MNARILIALLLAAALAGCVDNNASVRIFAACAPPLPADGGACVYPPKCESVWLDNLWVDTAYTPPAGFEPTDGTLYWPFQLDNQRPNNGSRDGGANTATAFITGYKVSYSSAAVAIPEVTVDDTTRTVEAAGSTVLTIPVIPASVATLLSVGPLAEVRAEIRAIGHYGDGQTFETGPFSVVVTVANGRGTGAFCPDPANQTVIGQCPQGGQSNLTLCGP